MGLFLHILDGHEVEHRPWRACIDNCSNAGRLVYGRISSIVIYQAMRQRADRIGIPLPFADRGGIILHPSHITIDCLYGFDAATVLLNNAAHPGCPDLFCDKRHETDMLGLCGFSRPTRRGPLYAWAPSDMKHLLELYSEQGRLYRDPGVETRTPMLGSVESVPHLSLGTHELLMYFDLMDQRIFYAPNPVPRIAFGVSHPILSYPCSTVPCSWHCSIVLLPTHSLEIHDQQHVLRGAS